MQTQQQLDVKCYGRRRRSMDSVHPARRSGVPEVLEGRPDRAQRQLPERFEFVDVIPRTVGRRVSHIVRM